MGTVEERAKHSAKRIRIQNIMLASLYTAGAISLIALAPNAARLIQYADPLFERRMVDPSRRMSQAVSRMKKRGLLRRRADGKLELSEKGNAEAVRQYLLLEAQKKRKSRWDGRWRIVMFDVWESRKGIRDRLRDLLEQAGFVRLQNSVWIYPYDCEDLIALIRTDLHLGQGLLYFVADGLEGGGDIKEHFGLR